MPTAFSAFVVCDDVRFICQDKVGKSKIWYFMSNDSLFSKRELKRKNYKEDYRNEKNLSAQKAPEKA